MSTGATQKLAQAQADLQAAQIVISEERAAQLESDLRAVIEQGRAIDELLKTNGAKLLKARAEAEPLWVKREIVSKTRLALDASFSANDFPSDKETQEYEQERARLTSEWHKLTEPIIAFSGVISVLEDEFRNLKFTRGQVAGRGGDLRQAIADRRGQKRF